MATHRVNVTRVREVLPHDNADRLEIAKVYDWDVVVRKGEYKPGDQVFYVPVDSILPQPLEDFLFTPDAKIKLNKHRVRSIKIRGQVSQGMLIRPTELPKELQTFPSIVEVEADMAEYLGITKYEPPAESAPRHMQAKKVTRNNPNFTQYTDIENFKYYDRSIVDREEVYVSEKLHGTSFRAGWFKNEPTTWWKKLLKFFGFLPEWEFCWGSRRVQIQSKYFHKGYYDEDVYTKLARQHNLKEILPKGYAVYGEIVGDGIQKNYTYGCRPGEHKLFIYDVKYNGEYLDYDINLEMAPEKLNGGEYATFLEAVKAFRLEPVPCLYVGPYDREIVDKLRDGDSHIGNQPVREGVVIRTIRERKTSSLGRVILKYISDAYYLRNDNTDFH